MSGKARAKKGCGKKHIKLPSGATDVIKKTVKENPSKDAPDQKVVELVEDLMAQPFKPCSARPANNLLGYFIICRWYSEHKSWAVLYADRGIVANLLDQILNSQHGQRQKTPIGNYIASFPKHCRNLIWLKWSKDPLYPNEGVSIDKVQAVISEYYNSGVRPPFSEELHVELEKEELPNDFSIIPNWDKPAGKKAKAKAKATATT